MSRDATFGFCFVLYIVVHGRKKKNTSSFMGGKGTYFNDSLVVKASGVDTDDGLHLVRYAHVRILA